MSTSDSQALAAFRTLLEASQPTPEVFDPVALTEALVGPELAPLLRRCAIPHELSREVLQVLSPALSPAEANERLQLFADLSVMQVGPAGVGLHDRWRNLFFGWWLRPENRAEFARVSRVLTGHFARLLDRSSTMAAKEAAQRRHMYHLLGADAFAGIAEFEALCRLARRQYRFAECEALIRLVGDYHEVLAAEHRAILAYHEGKLASDLRDWAKAGRIFQSIAYDEAVTAPVRANALVRFAHALRETDALSEAMVHLEGALKLTSSGSAGGVAWRALHEIAEVYRDTGNLDGAESMVRRAIDSARHGGQRVDLAGLFNTLGTIALRRRDVDEAVNAFEQSLTELERAGDALRPAQVHNNLALAFRERADWIRAEAAFSKSLELARQAGDVVGQANTRLNLSRVQAALKRYDDAVANASEAATLFQSCHDDRHAGIAKHWGGHYLRRCGDHDGARAMLEEAIPLLEVARDNERIRMVRAELSKVRVRRRLPSSAKRLVILAIVAIVVIALAWLVFRES